MKERSDSVIQQYRPQWALVQRLRSQVTALYLKAASGLLSLSSEIWAIICSTILCFFLYFPSTSWAVESRIPLMFPSSQEIQNRICHPLNSLVRSLHGRIDFILLPRHFKSSISKTKKSTYLKGWPQQRLWPMLTDSKLKVKTKRQSTISRRLCKSCKVNLTSCWLHPITCRPRFDEARLTSLWPHQLAYGPWSDRIKLISCWHRSYRDSFVSVQRSFYVYSPYVHRGRLCMG